jgi:predicted dehydrogenase
MTISTLRIALIGCGGIARRHVQAMKDLQQRGRGGFTITAVCDANLENAHNLAEELHEQLGATPRIYTNHEELLAREELDGADLCLPHGLHHSITIDCLESGVHVLCEKPIGVTLKAGKLMAEAAQRTGRILSTAVPHRRQPGQRAAHWVFHQSKLIGEPLTFFHYYTRPPERSTSTQPPPPRVLWRRDRMMSGGGMTLDSGFHYCDTIRYFFGEVEKVYAEMRELKSGLVVPVQERPEDTIVVTFTFKSGLVGVWAWSVAAPGESSVNVTFYGSEGSLQDLTDSRFRIFHLFERTPTHRESARLVRADGAVYSMEQVERMYRETLTAEEQEQLFPGGADDGFAIEIWEFIDLINGRRRQPEVDAQEGLRSLAIGEAIYESAITGDVIFVDDILSGKRSSFQDPIDAHWGIA